MDDNLGSCHMPERASTTDILVFQALENLLDSHTGPKSDVCGCRKKDLVSRMGAAVADGRKSNLVSSALPLFHDISPRKDF